MWLPEGEFVYLCIIKNKGYAIRIFKLQQTW